MDAEARKAAFIEAKARSLDVLERTASIKVEHRDHSGEYWERPEPKPAPTPQQHQPSVAEIEMLRSQDWARFVDGRISAALAAHDDLWHDVLGSLISDLRKQWRSEIVEQCGLLRADISIQKAASGEIIDLPALPLRNRRA